MPMTTSHVVEELRRVLAAPTGGVTGLVDELLAACAEHGRGLDWRSGRWRGRPLGGVWEDRIDRTVRQSVFRAVVARAAAVCDQQGPGSVSPYRRTAELSNGRDQAMTVRV